jgi:hypothetical protein
MKKIFILSHPKKTYPRLIEAAKSDIRKYIRRERNRDLPTGMDFWDFNCRFGADEATAETVHLTAIDSLISQIEAESKESFYVEIVAEAKRRFRPETERPAPKAPTWKSAEEPAE